ncbi:MAG TPA: glycosyltransferase [Acidimicrobiales bacterium]|nr:glycosyltransferase [Acidimicrobiales bacterium]
MEDGQLSTDKTDLIVSGVDTRLPERTEGAGPSSVLILSGEMGEGHNAAAAAITGAIAEVWPDCKVERFDTLELWGRPFARAASWGYAFQMRAVPATYEVFYDWLCRSDRFAAATKAAIGGFFGRRLQRFLDARNDDLVISTYPFGSAALDWLRNQRGYEVPSVTYVPAFHVHPVWTYPGVDQHFVMYDTAPEHARTEGFASTMRIGAPPVRDGFGSIGKQEARKLLDLDQDAYIVLVTGGAWGLGGMSEAARSLAQADTGVQVLAVCGKNTELFKELQALRLPEERLRVFGYIKNMHEMMAAVDVVITNGAGSTVLEALCTPRPVIAFRPLAGHGKASTAEMVRRNLAVVAEDVPALVRVVRQLATDEALMARMEEAGREWVDGRDLRNSVREMGLLFRDRAVNGLSKRVTNGVANGVAKGAANGAASGASPAL